MTIPAKTYDIILFGVTGFTGKLAAEYLVRKGADAPTWAACARNKERARTVLDELCAASETLPPPILIADLCCTTAAEKENLRSIVQQTRLVLSTSGPFERYGTTLIQLCAELGVHYADITGETDFFRGTIETHDAVARESGARIVCHCGNDCIPQDLTVFELHQYAMKNNYELEEVLTYVEIPESAAFSGGTCATAMYQLGKERTTSSKPEYDPLLKDANGEKSDFLTVNVTPRNSVRVPDLNCSAGPWIMAPVMVNCVRRSNALLHYSKNLKYGDAILDKNSTVLGWLQRKANEGLLLAAIKAPTVFGRFLPQPGQGPDRETMEAGYLIVHGRAVMKKGETTVNVKSEFVFKKDIAYLYTAALLVETGLLLLQSNRKGGVMTPAVALGSELTNRLCDVLDVTFEIKEVVEHDAA